MLILVRFVLIYGMIVCRKCACEHSFSRTMRTNASCIESFMQQPENMSQILKMRYFNMKTNVIVLVHVVQVLGLKKTVKYSLFKNDLNSKKLRGHYVSDP